MSRRSGVIAALHSKFQILTTDRLLRVEIRLRLALTPLLRLTVHDGALIASLHSDFKNEREITYCI